MRVIGTRKIQQKSNGAKMTGTGNLYYGSNIFTNMVLEYIKTGIMPEFDIQLTNTEESSATLGSQVMAYYGCTLTGTTPCPFWTAKRVCSTTISILPIPMCSACRRSMNRHSWEATKEG